MEFYEIGQQIKETRKEKKLSQDELAEQVGIIRQTLSKLEKGQMGKISLQVLIKILDGLNQELYIEEKKSFYYFDPKGVE